MVRPLTPPPPPTSPSRTRLTSPKKSYTPAPPGTHARPSLDTFWNPSVINAWTDTNSPPKLLASPRKSPSKTSSPAHIRKAFEGSKDTLATTFLADLDSTLNSGAVSALAAETGGITIVWSNKLLSTAGRAHWRREAVRKHASDGTTTTTYRHVASIELASKIITDAHRLRNVLAHEYCHLANFMISGVRDCPHGASFRCWAARATAAFAAQGVEVNTKHDYDIAHRYAWECQGREGDAGCGAMYERHSKSIDPSRHTCGKCRGRLLQIRPVPRGQRAQKSAEQGGKIGNAADAQTPSAGAETYAMFVKREFAAVRKDMAPGSPMKEVMREVGRKYREEKAEREQTRLREQQDVGSEAIGGEGRVGSEQSEQHDEVDGVTRVLDFLKI